MHIIASVFINDDESGLHADYDAWLERLAPQRPPALEPIVRAPIDLDGFAKARPAFANLEDLLGAPPPGPPEPQPDLDPPDRLLRHPDALDLAKLLAGQCRAEIGVARPERLHSFATHLLEQNVDIRVA